MFPRSGRQRILMNSGERWHEHRLCSRHSTSHTTEAAAAAEGAEYFNSRAVRWNCSHRHAASGRRAAAGLQGFNNTYFKKNTVFQ